MQQKAAFYVYHRTLEQQKCCLEGGGGCPDFDYAHTRRVWGWRGHPGLATRRPSLARVVV